MPDPVNSQYLVSLTIRSPRPYQVLPYEPNDTRNPDQALAAKAKLLEEKPWTKEPPPEKTPPKAAETIANLTHKNFAGASCFFSLLEACKR